MIETFVGIVLWTLILEDVAIAGSFVVVAQERILLWQAAAACFVGISLGDIGLYWIGRGARRWRFFKRWIPNETSIQFDTWIFVSRAIPGTRAPTYLAAGFSNYSWWRFFLFTLISVALWVFVAFSLGAAALQVFQNHWILTVLSILILFSLTRLILRMSFDHWFRKSYFLSFKKLKYYEFWPAWFFYIPIVFYYIYLTLKFRSPFLPFYSNPGIHHSGVVGESKWDFLKSLSSSPFILKTFLLAQNSNRLQIIQELIDSGKINYPFILKPDIGQRGYGVRIIATESELKDYLLSAQFDILLQEYSDLPKEAGVLYVRAPSDIAPSIFSITDKIFPSVTGDGVTSLGDLILQDPRAGLIASTYFQRFQGQLDNIPKDKEIVTLSSCGNHCQGSIFKNGRVLNTPELLASIDSVARQIPGFHFGRFDLKYESSDQLKAGKGFRIVEINGGGSEATHIWDRDTKLKEAYRTLFEQWHLIFRIGNEVRKNQSNLVPFSLVRLIKDLLYFQRPIKKLRISS